MLNRIILMGRLTHDPELRKTQSGVSVCSFSIAVDRDYKAQNGEKETDFIDIVTWRATADFVSKFFTKGRMAVVEGRLQIRAWQDKEGNKRRSAEVVADNVYFGDSRRDSDGSSGGNYANNSYGGNNGGYSAPAGGYAAPVGISPYTFYFCPGEKDQEALMAQMGEGLLISSMTGMHAGASAVSGDFSLQSNGFRVENGKKGKAIRNFTVAGNFFELLKHVEAVGSDLKLDTPSGSTCFGSPSLLVSGLSMAGK